MTPAQTDTIVLFNKKEQCCGCSACYLSCPVQAIEMVEDDEGFLYPWINDIKCISCKKYIKVCPMKISMNYSEFEREVSYE